MTPPFSPTRIVRCLVLLSAFTSSWAHAEDEDDVIFEETEEDEEDKDDSEEEVIEEDGPGKDENEEDEESKKAGDDSTPEEATLNDAVTKAAPELEDAPAPSTPSTKKTPAAEGVHSPETSKELTGKPTLTKTTPEDEALAAQAAEAALVDAPSDEISLAPLTFTTSTFTRFEYRKGYEELGVSRGRFSEGDAFVFRARLGMRTQPLPIGDESDVLVQFTPQASGIWGNNWGVHPTIGEANLGIYEGYLQFRTRRLDVQLGRMMMNYGDATLIGSLGWNQVGRAFDGLRTHYKMKEGYLDLFVTQVAQSWGTSGGGFLSGDDLFWGAYLGIGHYLSDSLDFDAYFLGLSDFKEEGLKDAQTGATYDTEGAHLFTAGLRLNQQLETFFYRVEGGVQFGRQTEVPDPGFSGTQVEANQVFAYQVDVEAGLSLSTRTRLSLNGALASGNDPDTKKNEGWNHLYPTGHKWLGLMDVIGARTNLATGNLKIRQELFGDLSGQIDGHIFARLQDGGLGSEGGSGLAGSEVDVQLVERLGKYAQVRGLYGLFIPASGQYASDDMTHYVEIEAGVRF